MKNIKDIKDFNKNRNDILLSNYVEALKNEDFKKLVVKLKCNENIAMKYTSKLERTVCELKNCKNCKSMLECKNEITGFIYYPKLENDKLRFNYVTCKYKNKNDDDIKNHSKFYEEPEVIKSASLSNLDLTDKNRVHLMKWINKFYKTYEKGQKGLYLHGSFGSGKTFILSALLNELSHNRINTIIVYYPELLRKLKESFNDEFSNIIYELKNAEVLLIDDIGAETVTSWSRDEILGTILQYRMDSKLTTFFTSNLNLSELTEHLSMTKTGIDYVKANRIIERIKFLTEDMELISENRRK